MRKFWSALRPVKIDNHSNHNNIIDLLNSDTPILDLSHQALNDEQIIDIAAVILSDSVVFKTAVILNFSSNLFQKPGVSAIAKLIQSGKIPVGSTLDLSNTPIENLGLSNLIKALKSRKCPKSLNLKLSNCGIGHHGMKDLLSLFESNKFPEDACINLTENFISAETHHKLMYAKNSSDLHKGKIQFGYSSHYVNPESFISTYGRDKILLASQSASRDPLHIDLSQHGLRDEQAQIIADAFIHLKRPLNASKCSLNLSNNLITEIGAVALSKALASGNLPEDVSLDLSHNRLGGKQTLDSFREAVHSQASPTFIKLQLHDAGLEGELLEALQSTIEAKRISFYFWDILQNQTITLPLDLVKVFMSYIELASSMLPMDADTSLKIVTTRQAYKEKQNQGLYGPALMRFGLSSVNDMNRNKWLFLLAKEMSGYGVTRAQVTSHGLSITFKNAQAKSDFMQIESQFSATQAVPNLPSSELVIQDIPFITHILYEYASIDVSLVFPEMGIRTLEFKGD